MNRILFFAPYLSPRKEAPVHRFESFISVLKNENKKVDIITDKNNNSDEATSLIFRIPNNKDQFFVRLCLEVLCGIELFFRILFSRKYDCYFLSLPPFFISLIASYAVFLKGGSLILDIRDLYPENFARFGLVQESSFFYRLTKIVTSRMYSKAKMIIVVTTQMKDSLKSDYGVDPFVVRNGYSADFEEGVKYEEFTCIQQGSLGHFYDIETLIKLAKTSEKRKLGIQFVIAGDGAKRSLLDGQKLPGNLKYLGQLSRKELREILIKCHVGLSLFCDKEVGRESFPTKVYEYIGASLPICFTPEIGTGEFITTNNFGRGIETGDVDEILAYLLKLKKEQEYYLEKVECIKIKRERFSRDYAARAFLSLLLESKPLSK